MAAEEFFCLMEVNIKLYTENTVGIMGSRSLLAIALTCCLFVSSCVAPISNIPSSYQLSEQVGVALLSITASGQCGFAYFVEIRNIDTQNTYSISLQDLGRERDWLKNSQECPSDISDYFGKLVAIELPKGNYEIYQLEGLSTQRKVYSNEGLSVKFSVEDNKVNYLGNLRLHVNTKLLRYDVQDMRLRDISLFLEKYEKFTMKNIIVDLLRVKEVRAYSA